MTDELKKKLNEAHAEELADHEKYLNWSKMFEANGDCRAAGILCDIAHEESTHAHALEHILEMEG